MPCEGRIHISGSNRKNYNYQQCTRDGTVAQWLVLSPNSEKVVCECVCVSK